MNTRIYRDCYNTLAGETIGNTYQITTSKRSNGYVMSRYTEGSPIVNTEGRIIGFTTDSDQIFASITLINEKVSRITEKKITELHNQALEVARAKGLLND